MRLHWPLIAAVLRLAVLVFASSAQAQGIPRTIGEEVPLGQSATGEACRLRLNFGQASGTTVQQYLIMCDGWERASADLRREPFLVRDLYDVASVSPWQRGLDRYLDCSKPDKTVFPGATRAVIRQCRMFAGGWQQVAIVAVIGSYTYFMSGVPTTIPLMRDAIALLEGDKPPSAAIGRDSIAAYNIRLIEQAVGGSMRLIGIQDMGAFGRLRDLGLFRNNMGDYAGAESAYRRALEIHERAFGAGAMGSGDTICNIALQVAKQRRMTEAEALYARAMKLVAANPVELARCLVYQSYAAADRKDYAAELALASRALEVRQAGFAARNGDAALQNFAVAGAAL
ncbi:MAG: tetratricopeptide repeat protein, partial [Proteobacteria bacterium]|nr:tetratricopeptide repeat protein [Pseudomonadota bacterium]